MTLKQHWQNFRMGWYQDGDYIVSRNYGRYPKDVPYKQGMTLNPGQSAHIEIRMTIKKVEDDNMPQGPQGKA